MYFIRYLADRDGEPPVGSLALSTSDAPKFRQGVEDFGGERSECDQEKPFDKI
jgi:hypothetical protein